MIVGGAWHDRKRRLARNLHPAPPLWQLHQIIRSHQPDEVGAGEAPAQGVERIGCVTRVQVAFDVGGNDPSPIGDGARAVEPRRGAHHVLGTLQRIARRDEQPNLIEAQALQCGACDMQVAIVCGIEAAAQQSDARATLVAESRQPNRRFELFWVRD